MEENVALWNLGWPTVVIFFLCMTIAAVMVIAYFCDDKKDKQ